jgi:RNA polymerase sigma factor (sigma-70 family)
MASVNKRPDGGAGALAARPLSAPDAAAIETLYRDHMHPLVRYVARRFGPGPPDPQDVAQAAFARLAASEGIANIAEPQRYLHTVAANIVRDHHRRANHREAADGDIARADAESLAEPSPERVLLAKEQFEIFQRALSKMPAMRRRIFLLSRVEGLSAREVAGRFGISEDAVYKHVARALADCATAFEKADRGRKWK